MSATTEWGVEMQATLMGKEIHKFDKCSSRAEAEEFAAIRSQLPFVKLARVVSRQVTTTDWGPIA